MTEKICTKCKISYPINLFNKDNRAKSKLSSACKKCCKIAVDNCKNTKKYEKYKYNWKKYREEKINKYGKDYVIKREKENRKIFREKHKDTIREYERKYHQTKGGKYVSMKNCAKQRNIFWGLTKNEFNEFWGRSCYYCGENIKSIGIDRIDSKIGYIKSNCIACCLTCNLMKNKNSKEHFLNHCLKVVKFNKLG